jgi:hypothetical protein
VIGGADASRHGRGDAQGLVDAHEVVMHRAPGSDSLKSFLVRKGFTETALEQVIQFYREIIDMVGTLSDGQNSSAPPETKDAAMPPTPPDADHAAPSPAQIGAAMSSASTMQAAAVAKPFTVAFDGAVLTGSIAIRSVRDIERLMKVLQAQKAAFEAMQEDEDEVAAVN